MCFYQVFSTKPCNRTQTSPPNTIRQDVNFTFFVFFYYLAPLPAAVHRSYIQNNHICKHGPDEDDLDKGLNLYQNSRLHVLRLRSGKPDSNVYRISRRHVLSFRPTERPSDRSNDRAIERPSDRATERSTERSNDRPSDGLVGYREPNRIYLYMGWSILLR